MMIIIVGDIVSIPKNRKVFGKVVYSSNTTNQISVALYDRFGVPIVGAFDLQKFMWLHTDNVRMHPESEKIQFMLDMME